MNVGNRHLGWIAKAQTLAMGALLVSCAFEIPVDTDVQGSAAENDIHYMVHVPSMPLDTVHVEVLVERWHAGDTVRFLLPPVYADNPFPEQTGANVHNVVLRDTSGVPLMFAQDTVGIGGFDTRMVLASADLPIRMEYDVTFQYAARDDGLPLPYVGDSEGYLQGTFLYAVPVSSDLALTSIWRSPWSIGVEYELGEGVELYGDPVDSARFENAYELLFSTSALGGEVLVDNENANLPFRIVNLLDTLYDQTTLDRLESGFGVVVDDVAGVFGRLGEWPYTVILGVNGNGGLEGMHAFSIVNPTDEDSNGVWNMIAAHELIHAWVGVRVGDYDDPWWKEATTNYLGYVVAARNGLCPDALVEGVLLKDLRDSSDVINYALSNSFVRKELFSPTDDLIDLVYIKGAQVCMIMDLEIRKASDGATSLDSVVGRFTRLYTGSAFTREEYLTFIRNESGADLSPHFAEYVDRAGHLEDSLLRPTYMQLGEMGAFGEDWSGAAAKARQRATLEQALTGLPKGKW